MTDHYLRQLQDQRDKAQRELAALQQRYDDERATSAARAHETERVRKQLAAAKAELAALHEGEEPYDDERVAPTPGQWITLWNRETSEGRLSMAANRVELLERFHRCVNGMHERRLAERWDDLMAEKVRAEEAEARIAAVRTLAADMRAQSGQVGAAVADRIEGALDGPAEQPAAEPQFAPTVMPEPAEPPTLAAIAELMERARGGFLVERLRLEHAIVTAVEDAGLAIVRTGPVEEVAAHPATVHRLRTAVFEGLASVTPPGQIGSFTGLPVIPDSSLPPGEVHLRPHPRPADGPS